MLRAGLLCNDSSLYFEDGAWHISGDPTEAALLVAAIKAGLDRESLQHALPRLDTIPFESEHQFMATLHRDGDSHVIYVKGALEKVLARSTRQADGSPFDAESRRRIEEQAHDMASGGPARSGLRFQASPSLCG